ncbi:hypothetical protein T492DRAFT_870815, partial [Pavlovales sp. CCMP2436]
MATSTMELPRRHFGTSRRAAARAGARAPGLSEEVSAEPLRRYRYVVHVREHTLIVPMVSSATVAELAHEVNERVLKRQLAASSVVDLQVRTEAGIGFLALEDRLEDVVTETDELVAVLEGSYPVRLSSTLATAKEVLGRGVGVARRERDSTSSTPERSNDAEPWASSIVTLGLVEKPLVDADAEPPWRASAKPAAASRASRMSALRASHVSEAPGLVVEGPPQNLAGKQREYLDSLLSGMHRTDALGVPAYKRRIVDELQSRSMHDSPADRPLLAPALTMRALRAQLDDTMVDGLPPISRRGSSAGGALGDSLGRARAAGTQALTASMEAGQVEERERRLFFFQNALSKLELDALELKDREDRLDAGLEASEAETASLRTDALRTLSELQLDSSSALGNTAAGALGYTMEAGAELRKDQRKELRKTLALTKLTGPQLKEKHTVELNTTTGRLKRAELRVSESVTNNAMLKERVNHFRKELKIFVGSLGK